jgi:GAF domain-containing protein
MGLLRRGRKSDVDVASCLSNIDRLRAVEESGLATTSRSHELDVLARVTSHRLRAPMAFVSIVGDRRVYFAGADGITGALAETRENSVEASYCQYVVALDDVLVVNDSLRDPLVRDHPATTGDGVRAYLGVPLRSGGQCLGSFCVVDVRPRRWSEDDLAQLEALAQEALELASAG